jgi:hypothetical protein
MQYNDIVHKQDPKYSEDAIQWCDREIKLTRKFKEDIYNPYQTIQLIQKPNYQEEIYNPYQIIKLDYKPVYQEEEYESREYGDLGFYQWLRQQNHACVAILAEIVSAPKLHQDIERLRPEVKHMKTITIDEYRKIKCIGSTKVEWLKQLKKKYGINVLRFLCASINKNYPSTGMH